MIRFIFLGFCFFGAVFGAPLDEKCEQESRDIQKCFMQAQIDPRQWDQKDFQNQIPRYKKLLECVGEPTCEHNQKSLEAFKILFENMVFWSENLVDCLGNGNFRSIKRTCQNGKEVQCEDPKPYTCLINEIRNHKDCTARDVLAFHSKLQNMVKYCELEREMKEMRRNQ